MYTTENVRECQQAEGPYRPNGKTLAFILDEIIGNLEVAEIVINGQTGMLYITTYDYTQNDVTEVLNTFNMKGLSDIIQ